MTGTYSGQLFTFGLDFQVFRFSSGGATRSDSTADSSDRSSCNELDGAFWVVVEGPATSFSAGFACLGFHGLRAAEAAGTVVASSRRLDVSGEG